MGIRVAKKKKKRKEPLKSKYDERARERHAINQTKLSEKD